MRRTFFRRGVAPVALLMCLAVAAFLAPAEGLSSGPPAATRPARGPNPARTRPATRPAPQPPIRAASAPALPGTLHDPTGLIPLTDLGTKEYKGQDGGLYGGGKNEPPEAHAALARQALKRIGPLDANGKPGTDGKVVMVAIGMSNTTMEFRVFKAQADADKRKAPHVVIVDTAQGGRTAGAWAKSLSGSTMGSVAPEPGKPYQAAPGENQPDQEKYGAAHSVWDEADRRVKNAGYSPLQIQVAWIKLAGSVKQPYPEHLKEYQGHLAAIVALAKARWPNLQIAYLSSRIYAGHATSTLNPEPWSYESAFGVRALIQKQIQGDESLNADAARGAVKAPVLLWGPYLWADGAKPRADGFAWDPKDFGADGTHPSTPGSRKVAAQMLRFFTTDPLARPWFTPAADKK